MYKIVKNLLKQCAPYGLMVIWLNRRYGIKIDEPLFYYRGSIKRIKRIIKFGLPYGLVRWYRHPSVVASTVSFDHSNNKSQCVFYIDSSIADQEELNSRMAQEVINRGIDNAN